MTDPGAERPKSPWAFVPPLYFVQGLPYALVETATTTFFAAMQVPVASIGHWSSTVILPWSLKPLWSPVVDMVSTKRSWTVLMQMLVAAGLAFLAFAMTQSHVVLWCVAASATIALGSATHDVACDGWYLLALDDKDQARFVGVRSTAYRLARIFVTGGIVYLAGAFQDAREGPGESADASVLALGLGASQAWALAFSCAAIVYACFVAWCAYALPRPAADTPARERPETVSKAPFLQALSSYFAKPKIGAIIAFIVLYRFGESMLTRMASTFLKKPVVEGGLAFSEKDIGLLSGTIGVIALIVGGLLGGFVIARFGIKRSIWPMVIAMHAPNVLYAWAAFEHPGKLAVGAVIAIEQLGYGFGFAAYMVLLMVFSRGGRFATTHYAISTGFMAISAQLAGFVSGDIVEAAGFGWFFVIVVLCSIPGMLTLFFVPYEAHAPEPGRP